jgi:23S rRNA pseudouridine1911/1915/1917 synthase
MKIAAVPTVLHCCPHLLVVNKVAGWLCQGDGSDSRDLHSWAREWLRKEFDKPGEAYCASLHRLDRPVSGAIAYARTSKAAARLSERIRSRSGFHRTYYCVIEGEMRGESGVDCAVLVPGGKGERSRISLGAGAEEKAGKYAELSWRSLLSFRGGTRSLLRVQLKTGRKHQIRAQLSALGHPIVGDVKYGGSSFHFQQGPSRHAGIFLHCGVLSILHPTRNDWVHCVAPPPPMWSANFARALPVISRDSQWLVGMS